MCPGDRVVEVGEAEHRVGAGLEPDESGLFGRRAGLVELEQAQAEARELVRNQMTSTDVGAEGNGDGVTRLAEGEHDTRDRGHAAGEEKSPPAFQLAEHALDLGRERMVVALIGEATELAFAIRPGGRAIESGLA